MLRIMSDYGNLIGVSSNNKLEESTKKKTTKIHQKILRKSLFLRDGLQMRLIILREFKRINYLHFSDDFRGINLS